METIIGALPTLAGLIEKGGIIGVMLIACGVLAYEVKRLRVELVKAYRDRDVHRMGFALCKAACDAAKIAVDLTEMRDLEKEGA